MSANPIFDEQQGEEPVRFSTVWKALALLSFAMLSFICAALLSWGGWVTWMVNEHEKAITEFRVLRDHRGGVSQNVNVGDAARSALVPASGKSWLTTDQVALREKVSVRTVVDWINQGLVQPVPAKEGKEYHIAAEYRIVPQDAAECGTAATAPEVARTP